MTAEELCKVYDVKLEELNKHFDRVVKRMLKKGLILKKEGRGKKAIFTVEVNMNRKYEHALTMYEEKENKIIALNLDEGLPLNNFILLVFFAIATTPLMVFRGTAAELLGYIQYKNTLTNREKLNTAIQHLKEKGMIVILDDDDELILAVKRSAELRFTFELNMIRKCVQLAKKANMRSWIPLIKIWLYAIGYEEDFPFYMEEIVEKTNLSAGLVRKGLKVLEEEKIIGESKIIRGKRLDGKWYCHGKELKNVLREVSIEGQDKDYNGFINQAWLEEE